MKEILLLVQIIIATLLIIVILLQAKGSGVSTVFGGEGGYYRSKRGVEKLFVNFTIVLAVAFLAVSVVSVII